MDTTTEMARFIAQAEALDRIGSLGLPIRESAESVGDRLREASLLYGVDLTEVDSAANAVPAKPAKRVVPRVTLLRFSNFGEAIHCLQSARRLGVAEEHVAISTVDGYSVGFGAGANRVALVELLRELRAAKSLTVEAETALETLALDEANPHHDPDTGEFVDVSTLTRKRDGSFSLRGDPRTKSKVGRVVKGKKGSKVSWKSSNEPCGRDARRAGQDVKCSNGQPASVTAPTPLGARSAKRKG